MEHDSPGGGGGLVRPRIIVCGGRDYENEAVIARAIRLLFEKHGPFVLVNGGCSGADRTAHYLAEKLNEEMFRHTGGWDESITFEVHPADWGAHGKAAGPIRNRKMASLGAVGCVAFPGRRGTADMVRAAKEHGIPVWDLRNVHRGG